MVIAAASACSKNVDALTADETIMVDLTRDLLLPGNFLRTKGVLIIRLASGNQAANFAALEAVCPHAGGDLNWSDTENLVVCPVHGSRFSQQGNLVNGPAARNLRKYAISISGNLLEVRII